MSLSNVVYIAALAVAVAVVPLYLLLFFSKQISYILANNYHTHACWRRGSHRHSKIIEHYLMSFAPIAFLTPVISAPYLRVYGLYWNVLCTSSNDF